MVQAYGVPCSEVVGNKQGQQTRPARRDFLLYLQQMRIVVVAALRQCACKVCAGLERGGLPALTSALRSLYAATCIASTGLEV